MNYDGWRTVRIFWDPDVNAFDVFFMEGTRRCERHFTTDLAKLTKLGVSIPRWCKYGKIGATERRTISKEKA